MVSTEFQNQPDFVVRELTATIDKETMSPMAVRLAHLSDLHFCHWTNTLRVAQRRLLEMRYDLLVVTGDFASIKGQWRRVVRFIREFFEPLADRSPVWAVLGNHDDPRIAEAPKLPIRFLPNESAVLRVRGLSLEIAGVEQSLRGGEDLSRALSRPQPSFPTILLAHYPSTVFRLPPGRVDLMLSGHTHGGQIRLPGVGCLWPNDRIPRHMARGLHRVGRTLVHVSAGVGLSPPLQVRINCPPECSILTLKMADLTATMRSRGSLDKEDNQSFIALAGIEV